MEVLQVEKKNALKAYNDADASGKKLLSGLFPNQFGKITDRVKTFEDACTVLGITNWSLKPGFTPDSISTDVKSIMAYTKLIIIVRALNEGWVPDWSNTNQRKWYPWMKWNGSGFGFSDSRYGGWRAHSAVGSRLCFKSEELAEYAAKQFQDIYNDFLTL